VAMAGVGHAPVARLQAAQRGHVGGHIAIGGRDERGGPAHDVVTGKQDIAKGKAQMIGGMAGGVQGLHLPVITCQCVTVCQHDIGGKGVVDAFTRIRARASIGAEARRHSARCCDQGRYEGGVIQMGMRHEDVTDTFIRPKCGQNRRQMRIHGRAGVQHGHTATAQNIGIGANAGHRPRIGRHNAT
jgi:hypothetical protein